MTMGSREDTAWNGTDPGPSPIALLKGCHDTLGEIRALVQALPGQSTAYTSIATGEVAAGAAAVQLPTTRCRVAYLRAGADNAGTVYLGGSAGVTAADWPLAPGRATGWFPLDDLARLWCVADVDGDALTFLCTY